MRLLPLGPFALEARAQLMRRAEASLDLQYYHLANDETGRWLLRSLRSAADRGVRVRLLIDDLHTAGADALFDGFAAHQNVQVRLYNPFVVARNRGPIGRFLAAPLSWGRINHRMHNKLFIADGAFAVMGGRNIANEYFLRKERDNFSDVDAVVAGSVLPALQAIFDRYWNSDAAFALDAVTRSTRTEAVRRADFEAATAAMQSPPLALPASADVLGYGPLGPELDREAPKLIWGQAYVFADHPDKPIDGSAGGPLLETSVAFNVFEALRGAEHEIIASSPYFIPGESGLALWAELRARGVRVSAVTNSYASTDEPIAHIGYLRYREALLKLGVDLHEFSQRRVKDNMRMFFFGASLGKLHAKSIVIDRRRSYIGSMNFDPRSAHINTELGAMIDSPELAAELLELIEIDRMQNAYRVRIRSDGGCCEWVATESGGVQVFDAEPGSSWWMRLLGGVLEPLTPESHL